MRIARVQGFGVVENQGANGAEIGGKRDVYIDIHIHGV